MQLVLFTHTMLVNIHTHIEGPAMRRNAVNPVAYYNTIPLNSPEFPKKRTTLPGIYAVHLRTKINDNKMIFEIKKQDDRRRNHNKRSQNSSI